MNRANKHRSLPALFAICVALLSLTGCIGGSSPAIKFYVLNPVNAQSQDDSEASPLHIEITAVRLPQYLERPQIVTRTGDNRLLLSEFNQWGGNLRKDMLTSQSGTGAWNGNIGSTYCTAIAVTILAIPYRYLPLYQK